MCHKFQHEELLSLGIWIYEAQQIIGLRCRKLSFKFSNSSIMDTRVFQGLVSSVAKARASRTEAVCPHGSGSGSRPAWLICHMSSLLSLSPRFPVLFPRCPIQLGHESAIKNTLTLPLNSILKAHFKQLSYLKLIL